MQKKEIELVNLTPHEITIVGEDGEVKTVIPPSGKVARVKTVQEKVDEINGIPIVRTKFGAVEGVPAPTICSNCSNNSLYGGSCQCTAGGLPSDCKDFEPIEVYIVSTLVAQAIGGRKDIVAPDTSPQSAVRDEQGRIVAVKRFQRW